ncbi:MAG: NUDIX domain-containing protein [Kordiimonas sp.]
MGKTDAIAEALPAASILLVRDGSLGLEVLMMERAKTMRFAPGAFVFPGGKVDREDMEVERWKDRVNATLVTEDLCYRVAALRELYEEASVLLTQNNNEAIDLKKNFEDHFVASENVLDVEGLQPFAHWVTPETMPRRFNTYFYIAAHNGQEAIQDGDEAVSLKWVRPQELLEDWDSDQVPLMFPTRLNLIKLARAKTVSEALLQAKSSNVARTMPVVKKDENGVSVVIDAAAGYGVTEATEKELRIERPN